jgi:uncharacterized protein YkwD
VKLARIAALLAAAAAGCALVATKPKPPGLVIREPPLYAALSETYPPTTEPADPVRKAVLDRINRDRRAERLPPVAWDEAASRVADRFCAEQIKEKTRGHFLTNGIPPYARTAFAGVFGMQAENSVTWRTTAPKFTESAESLALSGQDSMMEEVPPNDGHRRTILDPDATHVGVGYAIEKNEFRMAQEFLTRHLEVLTLERVAEDPSTILVRGKVAAAYRMEFVTLAHEPPPHTLSRAEVNSRTFYAYPTAGLAFVPEGRNSMRVVGTVTEDRLHVDSKRGFYFRFTPPSAGLWTIVFYTGIERERPRPGGLAVLWADRDPRP